MNKISFAKPFSIIYLSNKCFSLKKNTASNSQACYNSKHESIRMKTLLINYGLKKYSCPKDSNTSLFQNLPLLNIDIILFDERNELIMNRKHIVLTFE